jgi:hypothetical protein
VTFDPFKSLFENAGLIPVERVEVAADEWQTRDGRVLKIYDMDDRHLENTIRYIERTAVAENSKPEQYVKYKELCEERVRRSKVAR